MDDDALNQRINPSIAIGAFEMLAAWVFILSSKKNITLAPLLR